MAYTKYVGTLCYFLLSWKHLNGLLIGQVLKEPTFSGFRYSCRLQPGPVKDLIVFIDPAGNNLGACRPPPNSTQGGICASGTSPACTVTQDMESSTFEVDIPAGYISVNPTLSGNWKCAHGTDEASLTYNEILAFNSQDGLELVSPTSGSVKASSGAAITFTMKCLYPSASYRIQYQAKSSYKVLKTMGIHSSQCENTNASCTTLDIRAYGQTCSFKLEDGNLESENIIVIKAMVTGMLSTNYPSVVSSFIVTSH